MTLNQLPPSPAPLSEQEVKYDKLADLLVNGHEDFTNIVRTYFFATERNPFRRAALQNKLLGDAKAFAASNRPETIKHGMNIGFLTPPPPGQRRDVSMGMAQWISGLARLQNASEQERKQILGASFLRGGSGAGGALVVLLLILAAAGGGYYLYQRAQKKRQ